MSRREKGKLFAFSLALLSDGKIFPGFFSLPFVDASRNKCFDKLFLDRLDFFFASPWVTFISSYVEEIFLGKLHQILLAVRLLSLGTANANCMVPDWWTTVLWMSRKKAKKKFSPSSKEFFLRCCFFPFLLSPLFEGAVEKLLTNIFAHFECGFWVWVGWDDQCIRETFFP